MPVTPEKKIGGYWISHQSYTSWQRSNWWRPEKFLWRVETILVGSNHPACSHSESVTLCLPPCVILIWKDKLSSGNSHRAAYGAEEDTVEESFYSLSTLDTDCQLSYACLRLIWSHLTSQQQLFYSATNTASPSWLRRTWASELWSEQTTWCTMPPSRAAVLSVEGPEGGWASWNAAKHMTDYTICVWHLHIPYTLPGRFSRIAGILLWIYTRRF